MERRLTARYIAKTFVGLGVALAMAFGASVVLAADGERSADEVSRITRQVSQEIYSPYCPGQTLAMCPSSNASKTRQEVQELAREGMDAEEIKRELLDRYGDEYEMVEPSDRDQRVLLGGIVGGLVVATLTVGILARRRMTSSEDDDHDGEYDEIDGEDDELLLEELRAEYDDWSERE